MNKKPTILAVAALGSLAMIGTGFAGWVITTEVVKSTQGSVQAMAVTDGRVDVAFETGPYVIQYGRPAETAEANYVDQRTNKWFNFEENDPVDVLTVNIPVTFTYAAGVNNRIPSIGAPVLNVYTVSGETTTDKAADFNNQISTNKVIGAPTYRFVFAENARQDNVISATLSVTFSYGDHFKVGNDVEEPYFFYGAHAATDIATPAANESPAENYADDAVKYMGYIAALNGYSFKLTFTFNDAGVPTVESGHSEFEYVQITSGTIDSASALN